MNQVTEPAPPGDADQPSRRREIVAAVREGARAPFIPVFRFIEGFGGHLVLLGRALSWLPRRPYRIGNYLEAAEYIGFGSLPIVLLVGTFTGMVFSLQTVVALSRFSQSFGSYAGGMTGRALALELAPVLTALMLAGRAASGIATELGTMRISEQIDALESMAVNPIQFLVLPRVMAGLFVGPILTLIFFLIAMAGAYLIAVLNLGVDPGQFSAHFQELVNFSDLVQGMIKGAVFGIVVVLIGCYQGYYAKGGGRGVGIGTTRAVVAGSVGILVLDYFLSTILLAILPQPAL